MQLVPLAPWVDLELPDSLELPEARDQLDQLVTVEAQVHRELPETLALRVRVGVRDFRVRRECREIWEYPVQREQQVIMVLPVNRGKLEVRDHMDQLDLQDLQDLLVIAVQQVPWVRMDSLGLLGGLEQPDIKDRQDRLVQQVQAEQLEQRALQDQWEFRAPRVEAEFLALLVHQAALASLAALVQLE